MEQINGTTYLSRKNGIDSYIGDPKQDVFYPRIKIQNDVNSMNFSIGTLDDPSEGTYVNIGNVVEWSTVGKKVRFYPFNRTEEKSSPAVFEHLTGLEKCTSKQGAALYELLARKGHGSFSGAWYAPNDTSLMLFDNNPASRYITLQDDLTAKWYSQTDGEDTPFNTDIPVVRVPGHFGANPFYMDSGLVSVYIQFGDLNVGHLTSKWNEALKTVMKKYGVDIYTREETGGGKSYFKDGDRDVKFSSPEQIDGLWATYINLGCTYLRAYDYYRDDVTKQINDQYANGIRKLNPNILDNVADEVLVEFCALLGVQYVQRPLTTEESVLLTKIEGWQNNRLWLDEGRRKDAGYYYIPKNDGFEFEIELAVLPDNNRISLSINSKNLEFHYQPPLTNEEISNGFRRPPHIEHSYYLRRKDDSLPFLDQQQIVQNNRKLVHLNRPWVTDSTGYSEWCSFELDEVNGIINIVIPQSFKDVGIGPFIIDPTFGYDTAGGSSVSIVNTIRALLATGNADIFDTVVAYVLGSSSGGTVLFKYAIYNHSSEAKVVETAEYSYTANFGPTWISRTMTRTTLSAITYRLAIYGNGLGYNGTNVYYDTLTNAGVNQNIGSYGAWPDPWTGEAADNNEYSIFACLSGPRASARRLNLV